MAVLLAYLFTNYLLVLINAVRVAHVPTHLANSKYIRPLPLPSSAFNSLLAAAYMYVAF